jgi:cell division protein FtsB
MKEFQHDKEERQKMYSKWVLVILLIMIIFTLRGLVSLYIKQSNSYEEMSLVLAKKVQLEERYNSLSAKVYDLNTEEGMEKEIRSKFDVVKPGETVITVVDKEIPAQAPEDTGIIKKLWNGVVGVFNKK